MTGFSVNAHLGPTRNSLYPIARSIVTKEGVRLSIQASRTHYCSPQNNSGPYKSVEVMVLEGDHPQEFIDHHGRSAEDGMYGWMPVKLIESVIHSHGGLATD